VRKFGDYSGESNGHIIGVMASRPLRSRRYERHDLRADITRRSVAASSKSELGKRESEYYQTKPTRLLFSTILLE